MYINQFLHWTIHFVALCMQEICLDNYFLMQEHIGVLYNCTVNTIDSMNMLAPHVTENCILN